MWILVEVLTALHWIDIPARGFLTHLTLYGVILLTVLFLQLSRSYLQVEGKVWPWWIFGATWLAVFTLFEVHWLSGSDELYLGNWSFSQYGLALAVLLLGWAVMMASVILSSVRATRLAQHPYARNRSRLWFWPIFFTLAGDLCIFAWAFPFPGNPSGPGGEASPVPLFSSGRMPDNLFSVFLLAGFSLCFIAGCLSLWIVATQLRPKARFNMQRILREYSLSISNILETDLLATAAVGLIHDAFEIRTGFLFLVDYEKAENIYHMRGAQCMGQPMPPPGILSASSPVIDYFIHTRMPLSQFALDHLDRFQMVSREERAWLSGLSADVCIPIYAKEEWIGLLVLGPKMSGAPYGEDELEFLGILADQTAVALQNARLVESLTRLNNQYRRMYSALERANQQLERLDKSKSDFISIASHELRTPLSVIRGYSEILNEETAIRSNPYYAKMISGISAGILRLHEIVESMLDMASIDTRTLQLNTEAVSIYVLVRLIIEGIKKSDYDRKLEIQVEDMRDLPPVTADPEALRKVFTHLILNAIKFTPDGGKIQLTGKALPPEPDHLPDGGVEILVSDTGIGIAPDVQDLIFGKFYQTGNLNLHSTGKTKFKGGGQGLGLAIAKGIVEAHGGRIWVESPGYDEETCPGSKFHVLLPLKC